MGAERENYPKRNRPDNEKVDVKSIKTVDGYLRITFSTANTSTV